MDPYIADIIFSMKYPYISVTIVKYPYLGVLRPNDLLQFKFIDLVH